jgi:2-oxo-4-hydroxy-4-carboxy-5-ureidoimidazoline decarboxylase
MELRPSQMTRIRFLSLFADIFEHSPWIASQVWDTGLGPGHDSVAGLHQLFTEVVQAADKEQKLSLLLAHPQLAVGIARAPELTAASQAEQQGAGLDRCNPHEYAEFQNFNNVYQARFGFPFIMAVKGSDRHKILDALRARLARKKEQEFQTAVDQVIRIGLFRIAGKFESER